jgi:UDP-N-acetylmuramyl tripeptide synthase
MLKFNTAFFYLGPNLYSSSSGILFSVMEDDQRPILSGWKPGQKEVAYFLEFLGRVIPFTPEAMMRFSPETVCKAQIPLITLFSSIAAHCVREYSIKPAPVRFLGMKNNQFHLFLPCDQALIGVPACEFALAVVNAIPALKGGELDQLVSYFQESFQKMRSNAGRHALNYSSMVLIKAAMRQGIPHYRLTGQGGFFQLGQGVFRKRIMGALTDDTSSVGIKLQGNKLLAMQMLNRHKLPTAGTQVTQSIDQAKKIALEMGFPVVVKLHADVEGKGGVTVVNNQHDLDSALETAAFSGKPLFIERYIQGSDYRLLVADGALVAATRCGTLIDVTDKVNPHNCRMAVRAARIIGLDVAEIIFKSPDIRRSWHEVFSAIIGINSNPDLQLHITANSQRDIAGPVIKKMFSGNSDGRIPTVGITGSVGKTTTSRMVADILSQSGKNVALSTTLGAWIGDDQVMQGDLAGGNIAALLMQDNSVEAGVFELARGGLIKYGMVIDGVDVGVMLNVHDNHIGLNGIHTREELSRVKRQVVQNARKLAVLNADDPLCLAAQESITAPRICLVSMVSNNREVLAHQRNGGMVAYLSSDASEHALFLWEGSQKIGQLPCNDIPDSWQGRNRPALTNALFAMAAAHGLGVDFNSIQDALSGFKSTMKNNPGRNNYFQGLPYSLVICQADSSNSMREAAEFAGKMDISGQKHLLICAVGDRTDSFIRKKARVIAGRFSNYICTNYRDLRGERQPDEVPRLIATELKACGVPEAQIQVVPSSEEAMKLAYDSLHADDLLVDTTFSSVHFDEWLKQRGLEWLRQ